MASAGKQLAGGLVQSAAERLALLRLQSVVLLGKAVTKQDIVHNGSGLIRRRISARRLRRCHFECHGWKQKKRQPSPKAAAARFGWSHKFRLAVRLFLHFQILEVIEIRITLSQVKILGSDSDEGAGELSICAVFIR
jgi:hypothetical protein